MSIDYGDVNRDRSSLEVELKTAADALVKLEMQLTDVGESSR